jgi:hypothetical protein
MPQSIGSGSAGASPYQTANRESLLRYLLRLDRLAILIVVAV